MKIVSFFAGAGGLDLGFENAGFDVVWANEYDKEIWETFEKNHKKTVLDRRSIVDIPSSEVPDCDGIIGIYILVIFHYSDFFSLVVVSVFFFFFFF